MRSALTAARDHPRHVVLGALVAGLVLAPAGWPLVLGAAVIAGAIAGRTPVAVLAAAAVLGGAAVADARLTALDAGQLASMHGRVIEARAVLLEPLRAHGAGPAVARVRLLDGPGGGEQAVLRTHRAAWAPEVGDIVDVVGRIEPLGAFDAYQRRRNAHAAITAFRAVGTGARRGGVAGALDSVRRRAEAGLARGLAAPEAALLRGMVLGEDERLSAQVRDEFQRSGLAHVLAVSGQNVMLLAVLVLGACALVGVPLRARLLLAAALIAVYVPLAGGGPSIQRAGVMGVAGLVAALAGRPARRWYALLLAAAVTLALNPRAVGEPGWQLSFAAVGALLLGAAPLRSLLERAMPRAAADAAAITIAATIGTAPLMAIYFEQVSLAALPANLLAAPAIAPVMWLGVLVTAAGQVAAPLAMPFTALAAPLLVYIQWIAHVTAAAPLATVTIHASPFAIVAGWVTLAATALTALRRWSHAHVASEADGTSVADASAPRPGASRAGRSRAGEIAASVGGGSVAGGAAVGGGSLAGGAAVGGGTVVGGAAVGGGSRADHAALDDSGFPRRGRARSLRLGVRPRLVAVFAAAVGVALVVAGAVDGRHASAPQPGETVVSFLDVGQGDATLIQRGSASVLVDTGPPDGPILSRLKDAGIERLDALVVTHAEADHEGAAPAVISRYRPRLVLDGGAGWASRVQRVLPAIAAAAHSRVLAPAAGDEIALGGMRLRVLWPPPRTASWRAEGNPNDRAVVARLEAGGLSVLLTADAESPVTAPLELEPVDVLKVAHHGSSDPGLPALLQRLKPRIAAIEVGERNEYGHPTPSTLAALNAAVPTVLRTDRDGTVRLHAAGGRMWIERRGG